MAVRSRTYLRNEFSAGESPSEEDFHDLIDSFISRHSLDDNIDLDGNDNLVVPNGLTLNNAATGAAGTLRFNGSRIQFHDGTDWADFSTGGAFAAVDGGPHVAFAEGNVGIGNFEAAPPTDRLEVDLQASERARFGNGVLSNGTGANASYAQFCHQNNSSNTRFALRQGPNGDVNLNAPNGQSITISHNRTNARIFVNTNGQVIVGNNAPVGGSPDAFQVVGDACKTVGGSAWNVCSDARLKQDVRSFNDGLEQLMRIRPVRFRYNGRFNTESKQEEVGILGQEIEQIFPYMVEKNNTILADDELKDLRIFNGSALTYVMVNAIQELAQRVQQLETKLQSQGEA